MWSEWEGEAGCNEQAGQREIPVVIDIRGMMLAGG